MLIRKKQVYFLQFAKLPIHLENYKLQQLRQEKYCKSLRACFISPEKDRLVIDDPFYHSYLPPLREDKTFGPGQN